MASEKKKSEALRFLIVDDEEAARYGVRRALARFGPTIAEAASVEAAREAAATHTPT